MERYEIQNRRYLGNKYKLLSFISDVVDKECGSFESFFDVFSGTGVVSSQFLDKKIITNDLLYSNYISHIAWFKNMEFDEDKLERIILGYNSLIVEEENYMSINFGDTYFSSAVCRKIGYIREDIETKYKNKEINEKERAILLTSLMYSMDRIAKTCGHYDAYRKGVKLDDDIELHMLNVPVVTKENENYNMNSNDLVKSIKCDVAYLDPPYNSRQYGDCYHLLENVAKWEKPEVEGVAKKMNRDNLKSSYCLSSANLALEDLVNNLNCKYILLSYNNTGNKANSRSNAKITDSEILRILESKGDVKIYTQGYKAYTTGKSNNDENEERIFVCRVRGE